MKASLADLTEVDLTANFLKVMFGEPGNDKLPGLSPHQMALYHRIPIPYAERVTKDRLLSLPKGTPKFKYVMDIGGRGSGKSFAAAFALWGECLLIPGNKWIVVRKHHKQLRTTFLATFLEVGNLLTDGHVDWLFREEPNREDGGIELTIVTADPDKPSTVLFMIEPDGDREKIETAFRGYNLGGFIMEECVELQSFTFDTLAECLRIPGTNMRGILLSNPPDGIKHWVAEKRRESEQAYYEWLPWIGREKEVGAGAQPRILSLTSQTTDNVTLPPEYHADLVEKYKNDPIGYNMFVLGLSGERTKGEGVFKNQFNYQVHVRDTIKYNPYRTLLRGWDFGFRTPACIFAQLDEEERLVILAELIGDKQYVEGFCDDVRAFTQRTFPQAKDFQDWGDIAGEQVKDTGASIARARERGFFIRTSYVGEVMEGVDLLRKLLSEQRRGIPRLLFHPRASRLVQAMSGGYHFKIMDDGRFGDKPFKDNINDHPVDALRYLVCNVFGITDRNQNAPKGQLKTKRKFRLGS